MGLRQDLDLQGNDFSDIAAFLFFGLLGFEVVNSIQSHPRCFRIMKAF